MSGALDVSVCSEKVAGARYAPNRRTWMPVELEAA
jgi:hypothetical protein